MTITVDRFLADSGLAETTLSHATKERTIQDILDEMTPEQKELQALIVGAAIDEEDLSENPEVLAEYDALPDEQKYLIDFLVGNILAESIEHSALAHDFLMTFGLSEEFLEHFGVKGMKWGVRNNNTGSTSRLSKSGINTTYNRDIARARVNAGMGTLAEAHLASLKSTGHRAINAFTGDKRFWRNMAIAAGVGAAGIAVSAALPAVLPAGVLVSVGAASTNALGAAFGISNFAATLSAAELAATGAGVISGTGYQLTNLGVVGAAGVNAVTNAARAIRGNSRVDKSYAELGKNVLNRQVEGSRATRKVLNRSGSIRKDKITPKPVLKQSDNLGSNFLSHVANMDLSHALEAGSSGPVKKDAPKGDGKGGGRKFDESKVKRDGDGQFARSAGINGRPDAVSPDIKAMDAAWKNNIGKNEALIDVLYGDDSVLMNKVESKVAEIKRRTGVDLNKAISSLGEAPPKVTRAATEFMSYMATETNKILATAPEAVSPSKTQRAQYRLVNPNTDDVDIKLIFVPNKLKHSALLEMDVTFSEMQHALEAGSSGPVKKDAPKGDGKGGGRKFDESKVKRDSDGQFARSSGVNAKGARDDVPTGANRADAAWKAGLDQNRQLQKATWLNPKVMKSVLAKRGEITRRTGIDPGNTLGDKRPAAVAARREWAGHIVNTINQVLSKSPLAVSPSGTKRVQLFHNPTTDQVDYVLVDVDVKHSSMSADDLVATYAASTMLQHSMTLEELIAMFNFDELDEDVDEELDDEEDD